MIAVEVGLGVSDGTVVTVGTIVGLAVGLGAVTGAATTLWAQATSRVDRKM